VSAERTQKAKILRERSPHEENTKPNSRGWGGQTRGRSIKEGEFIGGVTLRIEEGREHRSPGRGGKGVNWLPKGHRSSRGGRRKAWLQPEKNVNPGRSDLEDRRAARLEDGMLTNNHRFGF